MWFLSVPYRRETKAAQEKKKKKREQQQGLPHKEKEDS